MAIALGCLVIPACAEDPSASSITADVRALRTQLEQAQERLQALRRKPTMNLDHWADAHVFVKAARWALDLEPALDATNSALVGKALQRAKERTDALVAGRPSWVAQPGRSVRGFVSAVDGSTQPYGLMVPAGTTSSKPIRLDVVLHGSTGSRGTGLGDLLFMNGFDRGDPDSRPAPEVDYIEVFPMGRLGENAYRFEGETDVDEAIEAVCRNFSIDRSRIVLRGSSLGGVGAWQIGLKRPDKFVAVGPTAGPVDTLLFASSPWPHFVRLEPLTDWQKPLLHLVDAIDYVANARMTSVVAAMGDQDPYFSSHVLMEKAFEKEGIPFVGLVDRGAGHSVSANVMKEQLRLLGERAARGIEPNPKHIHFVTWTLKFSRCHWIEILGLGAHYERAEIVADTAEDRSVRMPEPKNITRFAIHPPALQGASAKLTINGTEIPLPRRGEAAPAAVFERRDGIWAFAGNLKDFALAGKRPGLQGPIDDAFATRFLCVRGTGRAWNPTIGAWAEANLKRFAYEWRRHYRGDLPVKNDTDVTTEDLRAGNMILFGDPGSNRWIRDALPKLPVQWTPELLQLGGLSFSAREHGAKLICPNPLPGGKGHYLVLNSGHTYHDPELRFSYMVFPRLGDWAVMKVGENPSSTNSYAVAETVLHSGLFNERWGLPQQPH